ncbi:MAG: hypothetical protein KKH29_04905 [Candidatus Omnitrophica bacterium]|nr:hypothetical protein [Candidatus Omnitrophota bacterium]MCG2706801.1 hypothetical protein [Candidatus Omnitrophota bacterium]
MNVKTQKKIIQKTMSAAMVITFLISPSALLLAEDYPAGYLGPGHREYLSGKIQEGYHVEKFTKNDRRQKERVDKRNQVEEILVSSYQATPQSSNGISDVAILEKDNSQKLNAEIALRRQQREKGAAAGGEFTYIPYSDGKKVYFKDGLPARIENEKIPDEFGNLNIKNTYNMKYNGKRLLTSYEADVQDNLGNISHLSWYGASYTADSVYYGGKDTTANKNLGEYWLKETDSAGNVKLTHWNALSYAGKLLSAFSQTIEDSIYGNLSFTRTNITYAGGDPDQASSYHEEGIGTDGLTYSLDRTSITYNGKDQLTGYREEKSTLYPAPEDNPTLQPENRTVKTIVDAKFEYINGGQQVGPDIEEPEPDKLLKSIITATTENPDGSFRTETTTTTYDYNAQLTKASGNSLFFGQEASWFEYTDLEGHTLSRGEDKDGKVTYSYVDPDTLETVIVPEEEVTATLKDGNKYSGTSKIQYEVPYGKPMMKQVNSVVSYYHPESLDLLRTEESTLTYNNGLVNNLPRVLSTQEHTEITYPMTDPKGNPQIGIKDITTTYIYAENGNLLDAQGLGTGLGYELTDDGWMGYTSEINIDYEVILGEAKQKHSEERKDYK